MPWGPVTSISHQAVSELQTNSHQDPERCQEGGAFPSRKLAAQWA